MYKILAKTQFLGKNLIFTPECHSTNTLALDLLKNHPPEGTVVITDHQTGGRGQRGNTWEAARGQNLTFSVILYPAFLKIQDQFQLTMAAALALADYLQQTLTATIQIKWPNDLMVNGKKISGILAENSISGEKILSSVVGIGLNMNQTEFASSTATSVSMITQQHYQLEHELSALLGKLEERYLQLRNADTSKLRKEYLQKLYWMGEPRSFESEGSCFTGAVSGIDEQGRLLVKTAGGTRVFDFKEIKFIG